MVAFEQRDGTVPGVGDPRVTHEFEPQFSYDAFLESQRNMWLAKGRFVLAYGSDRSRLRSSRGRRLRIVVPHEDEVTRNTEQGVVYTPHAQDTARTRTTDRFVPFNETHPEYYISDDVRLTFLGKDEEGRLHVLIESTVLLKPDHTQPWNVNPANLLHASIKDARRSYWKKGK